MIHWDVYLVTQASLSAGRTTDEIVADAIDGGVGVVQLREKDRSARERYELGQRVRELTREAGVTFLVNDRVDIARALDADGVHLGDDDLPVPVARDLLGVADEGDGRPQGPAPHQRRREIQPGSQPEVHGRPREAYNHDDPECHLYAEAPVHLRKGEWGKGGVREGERERGNERVKSTSQPTR